MTYSTSNPPTRVWGEVGGNSGWYYNSADDDSTVIGANYVTNAQALGMKVGDVVYIYDSATPKLSVVSVTAVTSSGSTMAFGAVS